MDVNDIIGKSVNSDKIDIGVSVPKVVERRRFDVSSIVGLDISKGKSKGAVRASEIDVERRKSMDKFNELRMNGVSLYLLNADGEIVKTTSRVCGDDEYMFVFLEKILYIWKGGVSVFEDGSPDILFHRPHIVVDFSGDDFVFTTDIHEFDVLPVLGIFKAIGLFEVILGKKD